MGFVKKATLLGVSEFFLACAGVISSVIYARFLGPDGVGQFSVFMSTLTVVVPLVSLGIGRANIYYLNTKRYSRQQVINNSLTFGLGVGLVLTIGMTAFFRLREPFYGSFPLIYLACFSFGMACHVVISLLRPVLVAAIASRKILSVDVIQRVVLIGAALLVALSGYLTVGLALVITMLGGLAGVLLLLYFLRGDLGKPITIEREWFQETATYGIKIAASGIIFAITSSLTVLILRLRLIEDFSSVGYYTRAVAISGLAVLIPRAMSPLLYAKWSDSINQDKTGQIERAARFNVGYGVLAAIGLIVFGKWLVLLLYGSSFLPAYKVLYIFAPAMVFMCLFSIFNSVLASDGRAATTAKALGVSLTLVVGLTYWLVPKYHMYGAAVAVLIGNALSTTILGFVCCRLYGLRFSRMLVVHPSDLRYVFNALSR